MAARVSFVIPVLNERAIIAQRLRDLRARFPACECIVVDGGSDDGTVQAAMPLCDKLLIGAPGRAVQMNLGGEVAQGEYLAFLHADTLPDFDEAALAGYLRDEPAWGFCRLRLGDAARRYRIIEWCVNRRSRWSAIGTGDQMLFLRRELFVRTGGFDPIPLMEDVAYCKRLRRLAPPRVLDGAVCTSTRRWEEGGTVRTILRMWALRLGYFLGVPPARLWRYYYGG